jgi:hypothetical protein
MINESWVPLQSTLKRFSSDQLMDKNSKNFRGLRNFQSFQGTLPKSKCLICHQENYTKNHNMKSQINSVLVRSNSLLIKNSFQEDNSKDLADHSNCNSNPIIDSALMYPCLCSTSCHKICLINFCVVNMNFLCKNCKIKFPIQFIKQPSLYDNYWIQCIILVFVLVFHLLIFILSILLFSNHIGKKVPIKYRFWLVIFGIILNIINFVMIIFSKKFIKIVKNKRQLKPLLLTSGGGQNFDSDLIIENSFGKEIYSYLTYKHKCDIVDLFERKKNKLNLLEIFLTYENKVRNLINECKTWEIAEIDNINEGENNFFLDDSHLNFDFGVTLEGMEEESRKKFPRGSIVRNSDTGLLNLSIKDTLNANFRVSNGTLLSKPSLPHKSTRIYTGKSNFSLSQEQIRKNMLLTQTSIPYNNSLPCISITTDAGQCIQNGQGGQGTNLNINNNLNSIFNSNYNVISSNFLTSSYDINEDSGYVNRNNKKHITHNIDHTLYLPKRSINFNNGFTNTKQNFGLQEIKEELYSNKQSITKINHFLQPIPDELNFSNSQSKRSYRRDFSKTLTLNKFSKDNLNIDLNSNVLPVHINRNNSKKNSIASRTENTDTLILKDNKESEIVIFPKTKKSNFSSNVYLSIPVENEVQRSQSRKGSLFKNNR